MNSDANFSQGLTEEKTKGKRRLAVTTALTSALSFFPSVFYVIACIDRFEIPSALNIHVDGVDTYFFLAMISAGMIAVMTVLLSVVYAVILHNEKDRAQRYHIYRRFMIGIGCHVLNYCFLAYYGNLFSVVAFEGIQVVIAAVVSATHSMFFMLLTDTLMKKHSKKTGFPQADSFTSADTVFAVISGIAVLFHWIMFIPVLGTYVYSVILIVFITFPVSCGVLFGYIARLLISAGYSVSKHLRDRKLQA